MSDPPLSPIAMATIIRRRRTRARGSTTQTGPKPHTTASTTQTPTTPPPPPPHLLHLPGELRNQIYNHLVVFPDPIPICATTPPSSSTPRRIKSRTARASVLPLLLTSRQLHAEATAVFYSRNRFALPKAAALAPPQLAANLLARGFLDRIGSRCAGLVRELTVPLPLPATAQRACLAGGLGGLAGDILQHGQEGVVGDGGCAGSLIPALARRCPALEALTLDVCWSTHWLRLLGADAARAVLARLDVELRAALPRLKTVELCLAARPELVWRAGGVRWRGDVRMNAREEAEWVRRVVGEGEGRWGVTVVWEKQNHMEEEDEDEDDDEAHQTPSPPFSSTLWTPPTPRHATALLWAPPETALKSELHDQWTRRDVVRASVRFALAWVRSPSRAVQERDDVLEWRAWRRTMLAQACPVGIPLYCMGSGASGKGSRRERGRWGFLRRS